MSKDVESLDLTGERYLPAASPRVTGAQIHYEHLHRYLFASYFTKDKDVLDLGSGEGYGCQILVKESKRVIGVELDEKSLANARKKYTHANLQFVKGTVDHVPIEDRTIDVAVCFEVLEHISGQELLLREVKRLLKPHGVLLVSTPNKFAYSDERNYHNPFHKKELYLDEFESLLKRNFSSVTVYGQRVYAGSHIWRINSPFGCTGISNEFVATGSDRGFQVNTGTQDPLYFIAVSSDNEIKSELTRSYLTDTAIYVENLCYAPFYKRTGHPLAGLLLLYGERDDLQASFPEVEDGDLLRLLSWAATEENDWSLNFLHDHKEKYKQILTRLKTKRKRGWNVLRGR